MSGIRIRRGLWAVGAAGLMVAGLFTFAAPAAQAKIIGGGGCMGNTTSDITYGTTGTGMIMTTVQLPGGPASNIIGSMLFTTHCQPLSGTAYLDLQQKQIVNMHVIWSPQTEVSQDIGPTLPKGWAMTVGPVFCSGRHTYRMVLTWHGVDSSGNPDQSAPGGISIPSGSGEIFPCIKYNG